MAEVDKMHVRVVVTDSLEFLIRESIYYRTNNENLHEDKRFPVWHIDSGSGKIHVP